MQKNAYRTNTGTGTLDVTHNGWNQPVNFASGTVINVSLSYDGLGRMVTRVNNLAAADAVSTTDYYYAGRQMLESVEQPPASPDSTSSYSTTQYVWSARDPNAPIEQDRVSFTYFSGSGWNSGVTNRFYYLADANGNVTGLTDSSGAVVERYAYNAYGQYTIYNSTWSATYSSSEYGNTIFFAGMRQDQTTGIYYTSARSYNFSTGTFDTPDPINADPDTYRYAGNDPIGSSDPSGLIDTTGGMAAVTTPTPIPCSEPTPRQQADIAVADAIRKAETDMLNEGWTRAKGSRDAGAYGKELASRVQAELQGKKVGGGVFQFNTGVNTGSKNVDALNVSQGTKDFADIDVLWLEDGVALGKGSIVDPAKTLAYELKTSTQRSDAAIAGVWENQVKRYRQIFGQGNNRLAMSQYGLQQSTGKMIKNPNYSKALTIFSACGVAAGAYSLLTVDSAQAASALTDLNQQVGLLQNNTPFSQKEAQRRAVIAAAQKYLDVATGGNITNETIIVEYGMMMQSIKREFGE